MVDVWPRVEEVGIDAGSQYERLEKEGFIVAWTTPNELRMIHPRDGRVARLFSESEARMCHLYVYYPPRSVVDDRAAIKIEIQED